MADQDDLAPQHSDHGPNDGGSSSSGQASQVTSTVTTPLESDGHDLSKIQHLPTYLPQQEKGKRKSASSSQKKNSSLLEEADSDEEYATAEAFERVASPTSELKRSRASVYEKVGEQGVCKIHKFTVYETATKFYIVGADVLDQRFRVLKIDRTAEDGSLVIAEDEIVYTKKETAQLLGAIDDGNKTTGGLKIKCTTWGLLGFIRFTGPYYMLLITKRSQVAMIGGHYVYKIDATELVPLTQQQSSRFKSDPQNAEEARFIGILHNLDLSRSFYYSRSYDITRTLQHNITRERQALAKGLPYPRPPDFNAMFVWNNYLLQPAVDALKNTYDWCMPIIHGYIDQSSLSIYGHTAYIAVIARRSRFFAGARFLKRGANDLGYVANDVETEQIVSDATTTSFHAPGPQLFTSPNYTSYVQHRGSIPLYWTQDNTGVTPKPPIELNLVDPFYGAAALHFDNLFERYGAPVYVLNLVKNKERTPRESKLLHEYTHAINYLNQFLPAGKKIIHKAWDMSRASKSHDQDVIGTLEDIAEDVVTTTGFFHNGDGLASIPRMQNGVARTNCIDCLDRTNAAQFVIGKRALGHQLHALSIIGDTSIDYDTDAVNLFTHMYHDHGDIIAVQYGGSQLVNTMETYRKINQWTSQSRDMVESFKRYYNNSFLDGQRQEAYNLFLGNYIWAQGQPMLWDLTTDYYLHHANPRAWSGKTRRSYINWYTTQFLDDRKMLDVIATTSELKDKPLGFYDEYWLEYYKPLALSSFLKMFTFKMNSTIQWIPLRPSQEGRHDLSPFKVRTEIDQDIGDKKKPKKGVTIRDPLGDVDDDVSSIRSGVTAATKKISLQRWLPSVSEKQSLPHGIMKEPHLVQDATTTKTKLTPLDKSKAVQWTLKQVVHESLHPSVSTQEADDYGRYINHPQNLPLVVSNETPTDIDAEYLDYVNGSWESTISAAKIAEHDLADYVHFLDVADNPLTVTEEDAPKKRYKAYRKWLRGKSLFKQQPVD